MTKVSKFTLWNTSCIIFSHLKLIEVHFLTLSWLCSHWISPNGLKSPSGASTHPDKSANLGVNGSKFWNLVKSGWKYTKFAIKISEKKFFDRDPPPTPLMAGYLRHSQFRVKNFNVKIGKNLITLQEIAQKWWKLAQIKITICLKICRKQIFDIGKIFGFSGSERSKNEIFDHFPPY